MVGYQNPLSPKYPGKSNSHRGETDRSRRLEETGRQRSGKFWIYYLNEVRAEVCFLNLVSSATFPTTTPCLALFSPSRCGWCLLGWAAFAPQCNVAIGIGGSHSLEFSGNLANRANGANQGLPSYSGSRGKGTRYRYLPHTKKRLTAAATSSHLPMRIVLFTRQFWDASAASPVDGFHSQFISSTASF